MRGLGWIPDLAATVSQDLEIRPTSLLFGATSIPESVDLTRFVDKPRAQFATNSCVGFAFARAIHMRAAIAGMPIAYPSALAIYAAARAIDDPGGHPLRDLGCRPRMAALACKDKGIVAEERWPFAEVMATTRPPWDVYRAREGATVTHYRVEGIGDERVLGIQRALGSGYPVVFGMPVDSAYQDLVGDEPYTSRRGVSLGGHMQCLIGYGAKGFLAINSWGESWGFDSFAWIGREYIGSLDVSDAIALSVAPAVVQ